MVAWHHAGELGTGLRPHMRTWFCESFSDTVPPIPRVACQAVTDDELVVSPDWADEG